MLTILSAFAMVAPGSQFMSDRFDIAQNVGFGEYVRDSSSEFRELERNLVEYDIDEIVGCVEDIDFSENCADIAALFQGQDSIRSFIAENWSTIKDKMEQQSQNAPSKGNSINWKNVLKALKKNSDPFSINAECPIKGRNLVKRGGNVGCTVFLNTLGLGSSLALLILAALGMISGHAAVIIVIVLASLSVFTQSVELLLNCCGNTMHKFGAITD